MSNPVLQAARELGSTIRARNDEIEGNDALPRDLVDLIEHANTATL